MTILKKSMNIIFLVVTLLDFFSDKHLRTQQCFLWLSISSLNVHEVD